MRGDLPTPVSVVHTPLTQHAQHVVMHVTLHEHAWHVVLWRGKVVAHSTARRQPRADTRAGATTTPPSCVARLTVAALALPASLALPHFYSECLRCSVAKCSPRPCGV